MTIFVSSERIDGAAMNLNQVTIPSGNLAAAVAFYRRLGFRQIVDSQPAYARFECPEGDSTFSLHLVDNVPQRSGHVIYFECEDLDAKVKELKMMGVVFESEPEDKPWLWREAHLRDPDGNAICLYYAGENRHDPPWRLKEDERAPDKEVA